MLPNMGIIKLKGICVCAGLWRLLHRFTLRNDKIISSSGAGNGLRPFSEEQ